MYAGSDGLVKKGFGAHEYGFTSNIEEGKVWRDASITPGLASEMSLFRTEHGGDLGVLLMIYTLQIYMGTKDTSGYNLDIWINNKILRTNSFHTILVVNS